MSGVKRYYAPGLDCMWRENSDAPRECIELVLASDYDRDTQALREELTACTEHPGGCGYWREAARLREQERDTLAADNERLREALRFYADGDHFLLADPDAWDICSGEPMNFQHDDAGTASVEDGSIAKAALAITSEGDV